MSDRMQAPEGSEPEGPGFGRRWVARENLYLTEGALVRSVISPGPEGPLGLVAIDVQGRWNKTTNHQSLSLICSPDVAEEWGRYLLEAAKAARHDEAEYS